MQDNQIIDLYFARDEQAIAYSEAKYGGYCLTVSMNILGSLPDAEECVNDTWLGAWQTMPPKRPNCLRSYLGKITRNLSIDRLRFLHSAKRNIDLTVAMEELQESIPLPDDTKDEVLCELIDAFLEKQTTPDRKLFVARYWYGMGVAQLAKQYNMRPNTVSKKLGRMRAELKIHLSQGGYK